MASSSAISEEVCPSPPSIEQQKPTLIILLNNKVIQNSNPKPGNHYDEPLITELKKFNKSNDHLLIVLRDKSNADFMAEMTTQFSNYENEKYAALWIIFIGSAIEYGPVDNDDRCFNIARCLQQWNKIDIPKFLILFTCPHEGVNIVQHDAFATKDLNSFNDLKEVEIEKIHKLRDDFRKEVVEKLDPKINYLISFIPLWYYHKAREENILWCFKKHIQEVTNERKLLSSFLENIENDFRHTLECPENIIPIVKCRNDYWM